MRKSTRSREVIVRCDGGGHRVRLSGGRRFWATARCPRCRASVDSTRIRRGLAWFANLTRPASRNLIDRGIWWGTTAFLGLAVSATILIWGLGDRWWPATVLLFGPRWVLLLPLGLLLPLALARDRVLSAPLLLAGLIILGPVMGFQVPWPAFPLQGDTGDEVRVVSFNARGGEALLRSPANLLADWSADLVAFQECGSAFASALRNIPGWHFDSSSRLCFLSRFEILDALEMDREALEFAGGAGVVVTYRIDLDGTPVHLTNLHLETPRAGFELIRAGRLSAGILKTREKSLLRGVELRQARIWTDRFQGPHIVVGDFNTPPESRLFRRSWGGWQNAFSRAGWGFGGTRLNGWIRVRIDHILASDEWRVLEARTETDVGSDHLPVTARLRLR